MSPAPVVAPKEPPMDDAADEQADGAAPADGQAPAGDDEPDEEVLLTVTKRADGSYCLHKGDEPEEGEGGDEGGEADEQTFDSKGALLKGILDVLNAEEDEGGAAGGSDQFQAGFDESAPPKPATALAQKY